MSFQSPPDHGIVYATVLSRNCSVRSRTLLVSLPGLLNVGFLSDINTFQTLLSKGYRTRNVELDICHEVEKGIITSDCNKKLNSDAMGETCLD